MIDSVEVRQKIITALRHDLVGPMPGEYGDVTEVLADPPSRWYLTGFLIPVEAGESQRFDEDANEELDEMDTAGTDDQNEPEKAQNRKAFFPSSIGVSLFLGKDTSDFSVCISWGDYSQVTGEDGKAKFWHREDKSEVVQAQLPDNSLPAYLRVPNSDGLELVISAKDTNAVGNDSGLESDAKSVSIFVVNKRAPAPDTKKDEAFVFQVSLNITAADSFLPRPNFRSLNSDDYDERVADLQYRDIFEYSVGHNISTQVELLDSRCVGVKTQWVPDSEVERVAPSKIEGVTLEMGLLAQLDNYEAANEALMPFVYQYREWIKTQLANSPTTPQRRNEVAVGLLSNAEACSNRIARGVELLNDSVVLEAFRITNKAMNSQAQRRLGIDNPGWRPFQLAYVLMNLEGIVDPTSRDREIVDLLFFPTGGGKTEAYLGLAAFTLVLRRLRNPGISSAGLTVLMRYTLRLLTLDQLGRAAALMCALELERKQDVEKLGKWPFEIGLWVGTGATPNRMGKKGDTHRESARAKTIAFKNNNNKASPIPLEECPWCNEKFKPTSFRLSPNPNEPTDLQITCANRDCEFSGSECLPIVAVDEPIYRRLPCFMIATVDKFAALPWTGQVGAFFGDVDRHDDNGFYGPCDPGVGRPLPEGKLMPPELIIQDELHLISGPLGTVAGLYETAIDSLSSYENGDQVIRPKIIASTATVRRAMSQIRALFNRRAVDIFPPPGPDIRDSFFAKTESSEESNARAYIGVAALGRSPKRILLKTAITLMSSAQFEYEKYPKNSDNPVDPYMTMLGYFNSLRELGGTRRIIEDELRNALAGYAAHKRVSETSAEFANRQIDYEVSELTSRVSTDKVSSAKTRLAQTLDKEKESVDIALATNMISVGLDITRLGLMLVFGQPKTSAEYIQASSRVGREQSKPGLVVTVLNMNRPRDRSHYERFDSFHSSFYRSVEATSVTPFSPRALDRGLAGTLVAMARHGHLPMTPPEGAEKILSESPALAGMINEIAGRAMEHSDLDSTQADELRDLVSRRCKYLVEQWLKIAGDYHKTGTKLQYQREVSAAKPLLYEFLNSELASLPPIHQNFRANRSMRDVEPEVNLRLKQLSGFEVEDYS